MENVRSYQLKSVIFYHVPKWRFQKNNEKHVEPLGAAGDFFLQLY